MSLVLGDRQSCCAQSGGFRAPATDTMLVNSWMLGEKEVEPRRVCRRLTWPKNSRTHVLPTGQTWDGDCCTEGGVIVACRTQRTKRRQDQTSLISADGPRRGQVLDGGCGATVDGVRSARSVVQMCFSARRVRKSRFDWLPATRGLHHEVRWKPAPKRGRRETRRGRPPERSSSCCCLGWAPRETPRRDSFTGREPCPRPVF